MSSRFVSYLLAASGVLFGYGYLRDARAQEHADFSIRSVRDGRWSDPQTWQPQRVPGEGERVLISRGTHVEYDVKSDDVIRLVQVVGTLSFARDRDTELNVGLLVVAHHDQCHESGFACDFEGAAAGPDTPDGQWPTLLVGTPDEPIPAQYTARIRLHFLPGMNPDDAPGIACCAGRMEIHGSPLGRTWLKLAADARPGDEQLDVDVWGDSGSAVDSAASDSSNRRNPLGGWRVGDELIITATARAAEGGSFRQGKQAQTELRRIKAIRGTKLILDQPLAYAHSGTGEFRSEVANLSRNVIIESADPQGVRGHTVYHAFSRGSISFARFAHLGKEGVLGRYPIHFHLVGDSMRGSSVVGVAIVDSHNRWVTIHGTHYLLVRDCIGYRSVGHGFFMEDGTEVYNLLDRNLAVHAYQGRRLPKQVLPFDPNDGAGFWWANGRNSLVRNVSAENDHYGFRYDMQHSRYFDAHLPVLQPDGSYRKVDVRTIGIWRFQDNEVHSEGFYGVLIAANGDAQPDTPIQTAQMLETIRRIDWTGPDTRHPHVIRNLKIWGAHYAFRPHIPSMLVENLRIHNAAYGIYRPAFENHVYRNVHISMVDAEPFNRAMDDASAQTGRITVDGLKFTAGYGNRSTPLIQISDLNLSGDAATHLRHVTVDRPPEYRDRWPLVNRGVGPRVPPILPGVPIYIHDYYGPGRHAKIVSTAARDLLEDGNDYREEPPLTGDESRVAEVTGIPWPELLEPVDDIPPATVVTSVQRKAGQLVVRGVAHDNGEIVKVEVNSVAADIVSRNSGVVDWAVHLPIPEDGYLTARAVDDAGNVEQTAHRVRLAQWLERPQ